MVARPGDPVSVIDGGVGQATVRLKLPRGLPVAARIDPHFRRHFRLRRWHVVLGAFREASGNESRLSRNLVNRQRQP